MPGTFQVSLGWYSYPQIILNAATPDQVAFLKRAIGAYRSDDIFHQKKQPSDPYAEAMSTDLVHVTFGGLAELGLRRDSPQPVHQDSHQPAS